MWRNWAMGEKLDHGEKFDQEGFFSVSVCPPVPLTIPLPSRNHTFSLRGQSDLLTDGHLPFPFSNLCSQIVRVRGPSHHYCRYATDMGQPFPLQELVWVPCSDRTWPAVLKKVCCGLTARFSSLHETE